MNNNNEWNSDIEDSFKEILKKVSGYKNIHNKIAIDASSHYNKLTTFGIILAPLGSISVFFKDKYLITENIASFLNIIFAILMSILKFKKYEETISINKCASSSYSIIEMNIKQQLSLNVKDRVPAKLFFQIITEKFHDLYSRSPLIEEQESFIEKEPEKNKNDFQNNCLIYEMKRFEQNINHEDV